MITYIGMHAKEQHQFFNTEKFTPTPYLGQYTYLTSTSLNDTIYHADRAFTIDSRSQLTFQSCRYNAATNYNQFGIVEYPVLEICEVHN